MSIKKSIPIIVGLFTVNFLAFFMVLQTSGAYGQTSGRVQADVQRDLASALRVVRPLVRDDPQRAIKMLEALNEEYPTNPQVLVLMGEAHGVAGNTEAARRAYQTCLEHHPMHLQAGAALGLLYVQDGDTKSADATYDDLLERTQHGVNTYRTIASTLSRNGHVDLALRYYEEGRAKNKGDYILTLDIAYVHRSMGNHKQALIEYLQIIETSPKQHRLVKARIAELLRDGAADQGELTEVLEEDVGRKAPNRGVVMEILATTYLDRGMLESALDMAIQADEVTSTNGAVLFRLAELGVSEYRRQKRADKSGYFDLSLRALEAFLDAHPDAPQVPNAKLMLIELLVDLASGGIKAQPGVDLDAAVTRALNALDWLIASFPGTDYAEQAYLRKGDLVLRVQKKPKEALEIYRDGMVNARVYRTLFAERLGRVFLITEEYDEAQQHFGYLVNSDNEELQETGVFYSALMLVFVREYETARDTLTSLAEKNPSSQFTNDAIELAWIIEEGLRGDQRVLHGYARALQSELADDTTRVMKELNDITGSTKDTPLRARALIRVGELYEAQASYEEAIRAFETFLSDYPDDGRVADVSRKIGRVYENGYGNMELALDTYEDILLAHPYYIFLDEVREDVTRIRELMGEK
jgi:tetratricopeptide (TPR) repeat protein